MPFVRLVAPIIMLSAKDSEFDKVIGLELGADDYVLQNLSQIVKLQARVMFPASSYRPSFSR